MKTKQLKVGLSSTKKFYFICFSVIIVKVYYQKHGKKNENPLKWRKMLFISSLKLFLCSQDIKILSWLFGRVKRRFDWKEKVNFKIHDLTTWLQTITIHILSNISQSKSNNQTMKFDQLIEYTKRNTFLQK